MCCWDGDVERLLVPGAVALRPSPSGCADKSIVEAPTVAAAATAKCEAPPPPLAP